MDYNTGQDLLGNYMKAHPYQGEIANWGGNPLDNVGDPSKVKEQSWLDNTYQDWRGTLSPEDLASYDQGVQANYAKGSRLSKLAFLAAVGGMAAPGLLGLAGSSGSGAGLWGASDAVMGMPASALTAGSGGLEAAAAAAAPTYANGMTAAELSGIADMGGGAAGTAGATSPWQSFLSKAGSALTSKAGTSLTGTLLSKGIPALLTAYQGNKSAGQYNDVISQINQLYGTDSPYAKQMAQALARKDAAAGRNSQYGDRSVQLAAALTQAKSNALTSPGYQNMLGQRVTSQNQGGNALGALAGSVSPDLYTQAGSGISDYLKQFFTNQGNAVGPAQSITTPNAGDSNGFNYSDWWNTPQAGP